MVVDVKLEEAQGVRMTSRTSACRASLPDLISTLSPPTILLHPLRRAKSCYIDPGGVKQRRKNHRPDTISKMKQRQRSDSNRRTPPNYLQKSGAKRCKLVQARTHGLQKKYRKKRRQANAHKLNTSLRCTVSTRFQVPRTTTNEHLVSLYATNQPTAHPDLGVFE